MQTSLMSATLLERSGNDPAKAHLLLPPLQAYPFPGNIRELKNIVPRALLESAGGEIGVGHLIALYPVGKMG